MNKNLKLILLSISCMVLITFFINNRYKISYEWSGILPDRLYIYPKIIDQRPKAFAAVSEPRKIINTNCGNALIVGDSIAYGYISFLRNELSENYNLYLIPDNGRSTTYSLNRIDAWLDGNSYDLILANWGLWDILRLELPYTNTIIDQSKYIVTSQHDYKKNLELIYEKLSKYSQNIVLINTTPTLPNPVRRLYDVIEYNKTMEEFARKNSLKIIDLFSFVKSNIDEEGYMDAVHFNKIGNNKVGKFLSTQLNNCKK